MDHVARDDGVGAWSANQHRVMVDGVVRGWDEGAEMVEGESAIDDGDAVGRDDRQHGISNPGTCCWIVFLTLRPMRQLAVSEHVARVWKGRHPTAVLELRVPADMVDMQVRAHNEID